MVHYCKGLCHLHEAPKASQPKSGWELLAEAQAEAARNARIGAPKLTNPLPFTQQAPATVPIGYYYPSTAQPAAVTAPPGHHYYYVLQSLFVFDRLWCNVH